MKKYDLAIWGASGNVGRRVAALLLKEHNRNPTLKIMLIFRSEEARNSLLNELDTRNIFSTIIADSNNDNDVTRISDNSRLVVSCIGPFALHGSKIVKHCAERGTDYVDISGESLWIREMKDKYHQKAQQTGARIIFSCGFDSVPSDLSVYFLQKIARSFLGQPVSCIKARIQRMNTIPLSAGTLAAHDALMRKASDNPSVLAFLHDPFGLTGGFSGPEQPQANCVKFDKELGAQAAPFWGAAINSKTVHHSNQLLDFAYGRNFLYDEMVSVDSTGNNAALIKELGQFPSQAATADQKINPNNDIGSWLIFWHGLQGNEEVIRARVSAEQDPGYGTSSALVVESALCLLQDNIAAKGGVWTAASCLGQNLLDRLIRKQIVNFSWELFPASTPA